MTDIKKRIDEIYHFVLKDHPGLDDIQLVDWSAEFRRKIFLLNEAVSAANPTHIDALSGLPDRTSADGAIDALESTRTRVGESRAYAVVFIDIDNLKDTNDTEGHTAGDFLIAMMGSAIQQSIRPMDSAFRWGGDEFLVLFDRSPAMGSFVFSTVVDRIKQHAPEASYGVSLVKHGESIRDAIVRADESMYRQKKSKKS